MDRDEMNEDYVVMQEGRVMVVSNGETSLMVGETTLANGARISTDGTVRFPDGTTHKLKEGQTMLLQAERAGEERTDRQFKEDMEDEELRDDIH